jgi:hypothetical protein
VCESHDIDPDRRFGRQRDVVAGDVEQVRQVGKAAAHAPEAGSQPVPRAFGILVLGPQLRRQPAARRALRRGGEKRPYQRPGNVGQSHRLSARPDQPFATEQKETPSGHVQSP